MKNIIIISAAVLIMSACNQNELADSNRQNDSLLSVINERDSFINDFITSFNEVEQNLDSVAAKQHIITVNSDNGGELQMTQKSRINKEIAAINDLMDQNRNKIAELNLKIKNSSNKNSQHVKMITALNEQILKKDIELTDLNTRLSALNAQVATLETSVDTLTVLNDMQARTITDKTMALHTAYYVVGKSNELQEANIIDRKGGLLGIGRTSKLSEDFDNSKFTRIDYSQTNTIPVNSDMKIITSHPSSSYTFDKDDKDKDFVKNIVITNSEMFWSASKYLVIVRN